MLQILISSGKFILLFRLTKIININLGTIFLRLAPSQTNPVALSNIIIRNISPFQVNPLNPNHSGRYNNKYIFTFVYFLRLI